MPADPGSRDVTATKTITLLVTSDGHLAPPFNRGAAASALGGVNYQSCRTATSPSGSGHLQLVFAPSGLVQEVHVDAPPYAGTSTGACLADRFRDLRVPPYTGGTVKVGKTISLGSW